MVSGNVFRVGIIGCGFIGKVHAYAYRTLPFYYDPVPLRTRITHVVTGGRATADRAQRLLDADVGGTDYRVITENPEIDIVHVCTPNHAHAAAIGSAIQHGKHIYCDKPLVADWEEACAIDRMLDSYAQTGQMTFHNRFYPSIQHAKELVQQGHLGQLLGFRATYLHGGSANPEAPLKWKLTAAAGGGVIADLASHVLDLVEYLAGPIDSVMAATHTAYADRPSLDHPGTRVAVDAEDAVISLVRLRSGALGALEATKIATGMEDELRLELHGSRGALRFNLMDAHHLEIHRVAAGGQMPAWQRIQTGQRFPAPATSFPSPKASIGWLRGHVASLANFLAAVAAGESAVPDLRQGVRVQWLMECLRRSAANRAWVDVDTAD